MGSGFCDFCQVWHSAGCCHPGKIILANKEAQLARKDAWIGKMGLLLNEVLSFYQYWEKHLERDVDNSLEHLTIKIKALLADMEERNEVVA